MAAAVSAEAPIAVPTRVSKAMATAVPNRATVITVTLAVVATATRQTATSSSSRANAPRERLSAAAQPRVVVVTPRGSRIRFMDDTTNYQDVPNPGFVREMPEEYQGDGGHRAGLQNQGNANPL